MIRRRLIAALSVAIAFMAIPAITAAAPGDLLTVTKQTTGTWEGEEFSFSVAVTLPDGLNATGGFSLMADQSHSFVTPATYRITEILTAEQVAFGWVLDDIDCGDAAVVETGRGVGGGPTGIEVTVADGDEVTCVMLNEVQIEGLPSQAPAPSESGAAVQPSPIASTSPAAPSASEGAEGTPREVTLGGNPAPGAGGLLPDTATEMPSLLVPAILLGLVTLFSVSVLVATRPPVLPASRN